MGIKGMELLGENLDRVTNLLQKVYADEWLAYYQYWIGAKVVKGPMKESVITELDQHAADELRHATMIAARLTKLGVDPLTHPQKWFELSNCMYDEPTDTFVKNILEQNLNGEQCAINVYKALMDETRDVDSITLS